MGEPPGWRESIVDMQIRRAQERGEFDNLPGMGKPLPGQGRPDDESWWLKGYLRREELPSHGMLPAGLQLAREVELLPEKISKLRSEQAVRAAVAELNGRIGQFLRMPSGPYVPLASVDADAAVAHWRTARAARSSDGETTTPRPRPARRASRWWMLLRAWRRSSSSADT